MLEDSEDPVVKPIQPTMKTGRKWKVVEECLMIKEVIAANWPQGAGFIYSKVVVKSRREREKRHGHQ